MNTNNELINELQDFMFNEENIKSYLSIRNEYNAEKQNKLTENNKQPNISQLLEWESNLYWWIRDGDTIANITKTYVCFKKKKVISED